MPNVLAGHSSYGKVSRQEASQQANQAKDGEYELLD